MSTRTETRDDSACPHGTLGGYKNWYCRCQACRKANRDYQRRYDAGHRIRTQRNEQVPPVWLLQVHLDLQREQADLEERLRSVEAALAAVEELLKRD